MPGGGHGWKSTLHPWAIYSLLAAPSSAVILSPKLFACKSGVIICVWGNPVKMPPFRCLQIREGHRQVTALTLCGFTWYVQQVLEGYIYVTARRTLIHTPCPTLVPYMTPNPSLPMLAPPC